MSSAPALPRAPALLSGVCISFLTTLQGQSSLVSSLVSSLGGSRCAGQSRVRPTCKRNLPPAAATQAVCREVRGGPGGLFRRLRQGAQEAVGAGRRLGGGRPRLHRRRAGLRGRQGLRRPPMRRCSGGCAGEVVSLSCGWCWGPDYMLFAAALMGLELARARDTSPARKERKPRRFGHRRVVIGDGKHVLGFSTAGACSDAAMVTEQPVFSDCNIGEEASSRSSWQVSRRRPSCKCPAAHLSNARTLF